MYYVIGASVISVIEASMKFKPKKKMKTINWKKLARNTVHNSHLSLWKECTQLQESLVVDEDTIVELFCRPEIVKAKKEEKPKEPSVVSLTLKLISMYTNNN